MDKRFCAGCGRELKPGVRFCTGCGQRQPHDAAVTQARAQPALECEAAPPPAPGIPQQAVYSAPPAYSAPKVSITEVFKDFEARYKGPLTAMVAVFIAFTAMLLYANIMMSQRDAPIQYRVHNGVHYLSTTRSLSAFDAQGALIWEAAEAGDAPLDGMLDFDFGPDGNLYLANTFEGRIEVFSPDGNWIKSLGLGDLGTSFTLKVLRDGKIVTVDSQQHDMIVLAPAGGVLSQNGSWGDAPGSFKFPNGAAQLADGTVLVLETNVPRIQRFAPDTFELVEPAWSTAQAVHRPYGHFPDSLKWFRPGNWEQYYWPMRMYADAGSGRVYVTLADDLEEPDSFVAVYDDQGEFVEYADLKMPDGHTANVRNLQPGGQGLIAFVDSYNARVGVWDPVTGEVVDTPGGDLGETVSALRARITLLVWLKGIGLAGVILCCLVLSLIIAYARMRLEQDRYGEQVYAVNPEAPPMRPRSRLATVALALVLPGLGHIYLGKVVQGFLLFAAAVLLVIPIYGHMSGLFEAGYIPVRPGVFIHLNILCALGIAGVYFASAAGSIAEWRRLFGD